MSDLIKNNKVWFYSNTVREHFLKPINLAFNEKQITELNANGIGEVGSPACGDVMKLWLKINPKTEIIEKCLWQTFGCASAIASTSMLSVMVTENKGMKIEDALKIKAKDILKRLGGLPTIKIHCSVLGDQALRTAINDYFKKTNQENRIVKV